ncbi:glycosyltransferase family 4 protein [Confluentibacter lentus]|uniref:glycosyltransferase family 4 protein n=1 Tax=Confluentibacter lentus TaxID=1699412 RepID=UPI000C293D31|nr:glycosyltransferase family 4 protein [Confluentibacter lentus]
MGHSKKINFILPFPTKRPNGGPKVMYTYANLLAEKGYDVQIYHSLNTSYTKYKKPYFIRAILHKLRKTSRPKWFKLNPNIKSFNIKKVSDDYISDADFIISTWWATALEVDKLKNEKGKKINLIQDYENWKGHEDKLLQSYSLPNTTNVVIASYLYDIVSPKSVKKTYTIFNAIDDSVFCVKNDIGKRKPSILMLYSNEKRKGTSYGITALIKIKEAYPSVVISMFGTPKKPIDFPKNFNYHHQPENLSEVYNSHAIYLTTSIQEGFALPPCEALSCGCALIATHIGGHKDYLINNETGLAIKTENINDIIEKIELFLKDDEYRIKIAKQGNHYFSTNFSWAKNIEKLEIIFSEI